MCQNPCWKLAVSPLAALERCGFTPWFQVSGRLEPAKVVEREENKYDQQVRNCRVLATWTVEQKKRQLFLQWFVFHFQLSVLRKTKKFGERDAIGATPKAFIDLRGFWPVKPYNSSGKSPSSPSESSTWRNRNRRVSPGFFLFDHGRWMSGTINRFGWAMRKRGIRPFWSSVVKQREEEIPMESLLPWVFLGLPPLGTNISHPKAPLKMTFLFPRWDMLVPWRVFFLRGNEPDLFGPILPPGISWKLFMQFEALVR